VTETAYWLIPAERDPIFECFLLGVLGSRVFDWYARCLVDRRLLPSLGGVMPVADFDRTGELAAHLSDAARQFYSPDLFGAWGAADSSEPGGNTPEVLDGYVAHAYGLSRQQLAGIYETFHPTFAFEGPLTRALDAFDEVAS
jgi:hypothetical protein